MSLKVAHTPDGLVVRRIWSHGEDAWRWNTDGSVAHCLAHKGPWVTSNRALVPAEVLREFAKAADAQAARASTPIAAVRGEEGAGE